MTDERPCMHPEDCDICRRFPVGEWIDISVSLCLRYLQGFRVKALMNGAEARRGDGDGEDGAK